MLYEDISFQNSVCQFIDGNELYAHTGWLKTAYYHYICKCIKLTPATIWGKQIIQNKYLLPCILCSYSTIFVVIS